MEGRSSAVRRTRGPTENRWFRGRATTIRRMWAGRSRSGRSVLLAALTLVAASVAGVGVAPAKAGKCRWAHGDRATFLASMPAAPSSARSTSSGEARAEGVDSKRALRKAGKRHSKYMQRQTASRTSVPGRRTSWAGSTRRATSPATAAGAWVRPSPGGRRDGDAERDRPGLDAQPPPSPGAARPAS